MSQNVLVVAAHPDDEVLGCGGTIAKHADGGDQITVITLTDGVGARGTGQDEQSERRRAAAARASEILGVARLTSLKLPDNRMDSVALLDIIQQLEPLIGTAQPALVYTHHGGDLNIDHRLAMQAVMTACRPQPGASVKEILCFETLSSTEWSNNAMGALFQPTAFVDISATLERKLEALAAYEDEMRKFPHPRSAQAVQALASLRGASAGFSAAEAFSIARSLR